MPPIQNCPNCSAQSISRRRLLFSRGFADLCDRCGARVRLRPSWLRWFAAFALGAFVLWIAVAQWQWSHVAGVFTALMTSVVVSWTWLALADVPLDVRR